jgi:hypothetical protein
MEWVGRLRANTATNQANPSRTAHLLLPSSSSTSNDSRSLPVQVDWVLECDAGARDGKEGRERRVRLSGTEVEGRYAHRMIALSLPLPFCTSSLTTKNI